MLFSWFLVIVLIFGLVGFVLYKYYLPDVIATAISAETIPSYVPESVKTKMQRYKEPLNESTESIITSVHKNNVAFEEVMTTIDRVDEQTIVAALEDVKMRRPKTTNETFDIIKKYIPANGYDAEVFRSAFNENVNMPLIRKAIEHSKQPGALAEMEPEMVKAVVKNLLIQKEKEYQQKMANDGN